MSEKYLSNYSGKEYDLNNFEPQASLEDIVIATISNQQFEAESEADDGVFYNVYWSNGFIHINFCESYETNESYYGNTEYKETTSNCHTLFKIKASAIDLINIIIDYEKYKKEYIFCFGHRRMHMLNFQINKETEDAMTEKESVNALLRLLIKYRR